MQVRERGLGDGVPKTSASDSIAPASDTQSSTNTEVTASIDDLVSIGAARMVGEWVSDHKAFDEMASAMLTRVRDPTWTAVEAACARQGRGRAWAAIAYPESMSCDLMSRLAGLGLQGCVSPLHDRDRWPDGTPKKAHFHVLLYFEGKKSYAQVKHITDALRLTFPVLVESMQGMARYLCHLDLDPEHVPGDRYKSRYDPADVVPFGGFDYMALVKMTMTDSYKAVAMLTEMCRAVGDFASYADYMDYVFTARPELAYIASMPAVSSQMYRYVTSRAQVRREHARYEEAMTELAEAKAAMQETTRFFRDFYDERVD